MAFDFTQGAEDTIQYGDNAAWDGLSACSWAFHINPAAAAANRRIFCKANAANEPWQINHHADETIRVIIGSGAAQVTANSTTTLTASADNSVVLSWSGTATRFVINGTDDGEVAQSITMTASADILTLG